MKKILVFDGNFYLHRAWFTLRTSKPIETVFPASFCSLLLRDACYVKATHILVCFDGPKVFRYDIYPDYKANRDKKQVHEDGEGLNIYAYLPLIRDYLSSAGLTWVQSEKHEADDMLASAAAQWASHRVHVILGSRDKDGFTHLNSNVTALDSTPDTPLIITHDTVFKKTGLKPCQWVMYQTLLGDAIDNVPRLLSPKKAIAVVSKYGSFAAWFAEGSAEDKQWLRLNQMKLRLNKHLVEMKTDLALPDIQSLVVPKLKLENMPRSFYAYQDLLYPKARSLFKTRELLR